MNEMYPKKHVLDETVARYKSNNNNINMQIKSHVVQRLVLCTVYTKRIQIQSTHKRKEISKTLLN